jgi:TIR domain
MTDNASAQEMDRPPKARVFISYSRRDMAFADRLDAALTARGFEPLIDRTDIYAFEEWWKRIEGLLVRADTVVFVLSPDSRIGCGAARDRIRSLLQQALCANRVPPSGGQIGTGRTGEAEFHLLR